MMIMAPHSTDTNTIDDKALVVNGYPGTARPSSFLQAVDADSIHHVICVGFGPASLAIAVAIHDALEAGTMTDSPKVLFLEKQAEFAWHAGMLLPGAKMQISFVKDLASLRDPRSNFTFLNYLHRQDRLVEFTNLNTFLPSRAEYEDYLRWCSAHFDHVVRYRNEVVSVSPSPGQEGPRHIFSVVSRDTKTGAMTTYRARNVILAIGGQPLIPSVIPARSPCVVHSSQYETLVPQMLPDRLAPYRVAVVGGGQSAAEIFNNIQTMYPNSKTSLIMKSEFLKPSDDSPFVNSIFNPSFVDELFLKPSTYRAHLLADARATNYGVVRLELLEHLYEKMYDQLRLLGRDETKWPHRVLGGRRIVRVDDGAKAGGLRVVVSTAPPPGTLDDDDVREAGDETLHVDLLIAATGYRRTAHVDMLRNAWHLLPEKTDARPVDAAAKDRWVVEDGTATRVVEVDRNYAVRFAPGKVAPGSGIWLQGCCEGTHGLSDSLLSVLATRSGEIVRSIFGGKTHFS